MREEEGGKETRGERGKRRCKQRLDSKGATYTQLTKVKEGHPAMSWGQAPAFISHVDSVLTGGHTDGGQVNATPNMVA